MSGHAILSPSGAHRWLNCTRAPRLEATLPNKTSVFAEEGTLAHSVCEIAGKKKFKKIKAAEYNKELKKLKKSPLWSEEMLATAETFVDHLAERAMQFKSEPYVAFETKVDISEYVPESYGRCDCIMFGDKTLVVTDYKHGKGVSVNAENNPQLMLYAVGALKLYQPIFGSSMEFIEVCVDQPRINSYQKWSVSVKDLLDWCESIKPTAQKAFMGFGDFNSGSWCRFCRANGTCEKQAEQQVSAFDDFKGAIDNPDVLLTPEQIAEVLLRGANLVTWYEAVKEKALESILTGTPIPGWKAVEGRSSRAWSNQDAALEALEKAGIDRAVIFDNVPKTLSKLEKMIGAAKFREIAGTFVVKPPGKPSLADSNDKRSEYNSAVSDFSSVADN
ncbi:MAG: DUF2800 domain-containing protein [Rikenellaceae bacterium]